MAAKTKKTCLIIGFMVMSIIAAAGAIFGLVVLYSASAGLDNDGYNYNYLRTGRLAVDGMMLLLALAECVTAIISSAICCAATCCYSRSTTGYVNAANQTQQIILQPPGQQQVIYQMQPVVAYTPPQTHVQYPIQGLGDSRPVTKQQTVVPPIYTEETHPPPYGDPSAPGMAYPEASGYSQPLENHLQKM